MKWVWVVHTENFENGDIKNLCCFDHLPSVEALKETLDIEEDVARDLHEKGQSSSEDFDGVYIMNVKYLNAEDIARLSGEGWGNV